MIDSESQSYFYCPLKYCNSFVSMINGSRTGLKSGCVGLLSFELFCVLVD